MLISSAQCAESKTSREKTHNQQLAEQLGADDYGMKVYEMAFLKKSPNRDHSPEVAAELQSTHMANISQMAKSGDLVLAGPFTENDSGIQGIYIFNVTTTAEAERLTSTDPAIQAGRLTMELIPWYSFAALMQVNEIGATLAKKQY